VCAWQEMEKRAGIVPRSKADLERIVDEAGWKLLASVKIESLLESSETSGNRVNNSSSLPLPLARFGLLRGSRRRAPEGVRVSSIEQLQKTGISSPRAVPANGIYAEACSFTVVSRQPNKVFSASHVRSKALFW
jgi:hypothetical protein